MKRKCTLNAINELLFTKKSEQPIGLLAVYFKFQLIT